MVLKDDDIVTTRVSPRRSFLAKLGGAVGGAIAGALVVVSGASAEDKEKKRDTQDFTPADNKAKPNHDHDRRTGDLVGR